MSSKITEHLDILFEDQYLLIINKPSGIHSAIIPSSQEQSIASVLTKHDHTSKEVSDQPEDAGLVNRLDYFTSGCLIAAKDPETWGKLKSLLKTGKISKTYLALTEGDAPKTQVVDNYIGTPNRRASKVKVFISRPRKKDRALPARSEIKRIFFNPEIDASLIKINAATARRHQIRAHSAFLGHPLVGDELYGSTRKLNEIIELLEETKFFLLAETVSFLHPQTGIRVKCRASVPENLAKFITKP